MVFRRFRRFFPDASGGYRRRSRRCPSPQRRPLPPLGLALWEAHSKRPLPLSAKFKYSTVKTFCCKMYRCYRRRQRETTETQPEVRACGKRESQNPWRRTFVEPCTRSRDLCELRHRLAWTQGSLTEFNEFTFNLSSSPLFCSLRFLRWFFQPREKVLAVNVVLSSVSLPGFTENCAAASHSEIRWNVVLQSSPAGT